LFLNRRGFANFLVCAQCGEALKCKNCDVSLTLHKSVNAHKCHYCGFTQPAVTACSHCGSRRIKQLGLGTEKIEHAVLRLFPQARVARLDRDTTTRRGSMVKILKELKTGTIDILIGTQMVAKGHDFPNITLVGIICADLTLSFPDFRAGERTFQLLAQVAGRAGRGDTPGHVILQTYNPEHFSIQTARQQDFRKFYTAEIGFRKALGFPPYQRLIQIRISGQDKESAESRACALAERCNELCETVSAFRRSVEVLGPIEAPLTKIANRYRWQLLLKGRSTQLLHRFVRALLFDQSSPPKSRRVKVSIDVDPFFMM
jgi:primosomal protein N' (replication factor Y)